MGYHFWKHKEYQVAEKFKEAGFNAKRVPLSRNIMNNSSEDVIVYDLKLMIDVKSTIGKSMINIKREDLEKIINSAKKTDQLGVLSFSYKGDKNHYLILALEDFINLVKKLNV